MHFNLIRCRQLKKYLKSPCVGFQSQKSNVFFSLFLAADK